MDRRSSRRIRLGLPALAGIALGIPLLDFLASRPLNPGRAIPSPQAPLEPGAAPLGRTDFDLTASAVPTIPFTPEPPLAAAISGNPIPSCCSSETASGPQDPKSEIRNPKSEGPKSEIRNPKSPEAFAAFRAWMFRFDRAAAAEEKAALVAEGARLAGERRAALKRLIEKDPEMALEEALPRAAVKGLPPQIAREVEEFVSSRGDFLVIGKIPVPAQAGEAGTRATPPPDAEPFVPVERKAAFSGKTYTASVYGRRLGQATSTSIPMHGIALDGVMAVHENPLRRLEPGETKDPAAPSGNPDGNCVASGRKASEEIAADVGGTVYTFCHDDHLLAYDGSLIAAEGEGGSGGSAPLAASAWTEGPKDVLFIRVDFSDLTGEPISQASAQTLIDSSVNGYFQGAAYGKVSLAATVTPVFRMPQTKAWYAANNATGQLMTDARNAAAAGGYVNAGYELDVIGFKTIFSGWAGMAYIGAKGTWLNGYFGWSTAAHELGHNFGAHHSNFYSVTDDSIIGTGTSIEYGNPFDVMGGGDYTYSHFMAWHKNRFNWITAAETASVTAATSGTYRIHALEDPVPAGGLHAIKVVKDASKNYWIEFRQGNTSNASLMNGASINFGYNNITQSNLLDMSPETAGATDSGLVIGRTFSDTAAGIHITPIGKGGTVPESLDVVVNVGPFAGNQPPAVTLGASATSVAIGATVNFTATASDPDGNPLAYHWDLGTTTLVSPNGPTASRTFSAAGYYPIQCRVSDMRGGVGADSVVIQVGTPVNSYRVTGQVTASGAPIAMARVFDGNKSVYTDSDGTYTLIEGISAVTLAARKPGYTFLPDGFTNPFTASGDTGGINFSTAPAPPAVDLVVDAVTGIDSGTTIYCADTVRNAGTGGTAVSFKVRYVLSPDTNIQVADIFLGERTVTGLAAGATSSGSGTFAKPSGLTGTSFYVGVYVDILNSVPETNEANNGRATAAPVVTLYPDLYFSLFTSRIALGKVTITNKVSNQGVSASSGPFAVAFYLSANTTYEAADILLGTRTITSSIAIGGTNSDTTKFSAPASTPPGSYYVIGRIDSGSAMAETNEGNNNATASPALPIRADLVSTAVTVTRTLTTLNATDTVRNDGPLATSGSFVVNYYLSTDGTITTSDLFLGSRTVAASIAYNATNTGTTALAIPASVVRGSYRVGVIVDATGAVPETVETNNTRDSATIKLQTDLVASAITAGVSGGRTVTITETVRNDGCFAAAASFQVGLYLSTNSGIGGTDTLIGSRTVPTGLAVGATSAATTVITVPATVPAGAYFVGSWADKAGAVVEVEETSNNTKATAGTVTIGP